VKIRKGDTVVVIRGDDKGKSGRVLSVDPEKGVLIVQRVRLVVRHQKPGRKQAVRQGEVEKEAPIPISAVALVDPKTDKPTRVRSRRPEKDVTDRVAARRAKSRESVRTGMDIEKPAFKPRS